MDGDGGVAPTIGPVNGISVPISVGGGEVYWTWTADSNLRVAFSLKHTDSITGFVTIIQQGQSPSAVHVDFGVNDLRGDTLAWDFLCKPLNAGTWPVYVQFFQGTQATGYQPISAVIQYDVKVPPAVAISDSIVFA